jgi:1-acyl-sn-glycerol-3-phosphate acyltransferase
MNAVRTAVRLGRLAITALDTIVRARATPDGIRGRAARFNTTCAEIARIHGLQLRIRGTWPAGPVVIVANHVSYLDPIGIAAMVPCAPIAKSEVASWPVIGTAASGLGVIFVVRNSVSSRARALRHAHAALRAGVSVVNFPEGTTTDGTRLLPFKRGIFGLARLAGVPVLPVAIRCAPELAWHGNAPFVPHYVATAGLAAPEMRFDLGQLIDPAKFASDDEVAAVAHHRIAYLLRDQLESHAAIIRLRVPSPWTDAVLPAADRRIAR